MGRRVRPELNTLSDHDQKRGKSEYVLCQLSKVTRLLS